MDFVLDMKVAGVRFVSACYLAVVCVNMQWVVDWIPLCWLINIGNRPALPHDLTYDWSVLKTKMQSGLCSHLQCVSVAFVYSWTFVYLLAANLVHTVCNIFLSFPIHIFPRLSFLWMTRAVCANMWKCHQGNIQGHAGHSRLIRWSDRVNLK